MRPDVYGEPITLIIIFCNLSILLSCCARENSKWFASLLYHQIEYSSYIIVDNVVVIIILSIMGMIITIVCTMYYAYKFIMPRIMLSIVGTCKVCVLEQHEILTVHFFPELLLYLHKVHRRV